MKDTSSDVFPLIIGILILSIYILSIIVVRFRGLRNCDGKIIDIDDEKQMLIIRYKIDKNTFQDIAYTAKRYFLLGNIPPVGLKVIVSVLMDNPYKATNVYIRSDTRKRFSRTGFLHSSKLRLALLFFGLSGFFILGGIVILLNS